ncbi:MAG: VCBS repeat-containing protein, partial [Bacteroidetes bacterium]|nr:VCBS repeat-containing protein [Bacteroidota bacterium]
MKKNIYISFMFLISSLCIAQQNTFKKDAELKRFVERGGKVEETSPNIYKLTYPDGLSRVYNLNRKEDRIENLEDVDTTIINIWEIDTTKYSDRFSFWQKVDIANSIFLPILVDDLNENKLPELYGYKDYINIPLPSGGPVEIFEKDLTGIYNSIYTYDSSTVFAQAIGYLRETHKNILYVKSRYTNNGLVYISDSLGNLPTKFDFIFYYTPNQINDMTFGDFDKNGITDCAFIDGAGTQKIIIGEYRKNINNFTTVFTDSTTNLVEYSGFAINDFDLDNKTELVFGSGQGTIQVIENIDTNQYSIVWQTMFPTYNAYMKTATNDIDRNGKPEFWIGGQDFENGISVFVCYEVDGNNSYNPVAMIELRYLVSLNANYLQAADVDGDGKDELIISLGEYIIILRFTGRPNYHSYEIFYVKNNEQTQPGNRFYPVTIYDLDRDGKKDILLPMDIFINPNTISFSYILKQNDISSIDEEKE